jgi:hypothetical protein
LIFASHCGNRSNVENGLYKTEFQIAQGTGRGMLYVRDGKMLGGNSAFAFVGTYAVDGDTISVDISTVRHNDDPNFRPLFGVDVITLKLTGHPTATGYAFEGGAVQVPGVLFRSVMTRVDNDDTVVDTVDNGIRRGLYSMHVKMLDGVTGGNTGVLVLDRGRIRGGDAFFYYVGSYSRGDGRWKGSLINYEHAPAHHEHPLFGGRDVGIGFSGSYTDKGADIDATALVGKRSIRFHAVLKLIADI